MPSAPKRVCLKSGCGKVVSGSYCEEHFNQRQSQQIEKTKCYDKERGSASSRGYDSRWAKYSKQFRQNNPLCAECERKGRIKLGNHVDHIIPVNGKDDPLFWDTKNHQNLCVSCHSCKTALEDGGFGNKKGN